LIDKTFPDHKVIHTIVMDFDGVFTDNKVWVDQNGLESVRCDRGDGLGFDLLRSFMKINNWALSISNKANYLLNYLAENDLSSRGLIYLGNDLNDLSAMQIAGFSVAPSDAHRMILDQADLVLTQQGGDGFVRAFIELLIGLDKMSCKEVMELL